MQHFEGYLRGVGKQHVTRTEENMIISADFT